MTRMVATAAALLIMSASLHAQKPVPEAAAERYWRGGVGILAGTAGLGPSLDVSLNTATRLYRARMTVHENTIGATTYRERYTLSETALMVGRGRRFTRNYASVAAGVALVQRLDDDETRETTTVGVPVEAMLVSGAMPRIGIALIGNVNANRPFAAVVVSLQFGRIP
jgi:hypothetical protein